MTTPPRVLVVDDEVILARTIGLHLAKAGFDVRICTEPEKALERIGAENPDVLVLDWMMPVVSGLDILDAVRGDPSVRSLPILFLSSRAAVQDQVAVLRRGADDFVQKPFDPEDLVVRVERLVARSRPLRGSLHPRAHRRCLAEP